MIDLERLIKLTPAQYSTLANGGTVGSYTGLDNNYIYLVEDNTEYLPLTGGTLTGALQFGNNQHRISKEDGTTLTRYTGATVTLPAISSNSKGMAMLADEGGDFGLLYVGSDGSVIANSGDNGYIFKVYDKDQNATDYTSSSGLVLGVKQGGAGIEIAQGDLSVAGSISEGGTSLSNKYLQLSGGTMTGPLSWSGETALPQKDLQYILGIDSFASGGQTGWQSKSNFLSGYATETWVGNNYLGKTAKAADSDLLDGNDSSYFYPASNPSGFITGVTQQDVTTALNLGTVNNSTSWGTLTAAKGYTVRWGSDQPSGGGLVFAEKSGQTSMQLDGEIYVGEGQYRLAHVGEAQPASDVYNWAKQANKPSYNFSEIQPGNIVIGDGANTYYYRTGNGVKSGFYYHTAGDESVVFANQYAGTGWMFVEQTNPDDRTSWQSLSPTLQIKKGGVVINKLIGQGATPSYNLDVNGTGHFSSNLQIDGSITNLAVNGGIYWNPYVESSSDSSDAASITVVSSGALGGTELRISQQNDANDCINLLTNSHILFNSKRAFNISDSWLRINENGDFSSGIYTGGSLVRTDYRLEVGSGGSAFSATNNGQVYADASVQVKNCKMQYNTSEDCLDFIFA